MKKVTKKKVPPVTRVRMPGVGAPKKPRRRTSAAMVKEIDRRFDYVHLVGKDKTDDCIAVRAAFKKLAMTVARITPPGREQAMALTKLEEGLFNAIASIVRPKQGE